MVTVDALNKIKVLFRDPNTFALYGIPYKMRPGQAPGDLYRAHRDYVPPEYGTYGSKQININDWIWLGSPGWYGHLTTTEQVLIQAFLSTLGELVPHGPYEWCEVG